MSSKSERNLDECFRNFKSQISNIPLPEKFTYPFNYTPHKLCEIAVAELQEFLLHESNLIHDFGIEHWVEGTNVGKMFGVLVVQKENGEIGYLAAFSGKLIDGNTIKGFVPPIFDSLEEGGFYKLGEDEIVGINKQIVEIENSSQYKMSCLNLQAKILEADELLLQQKKDIKESKRVRDEKRSWANLHLTGMEYEAFVETLKNESIKQHYDFKYISRIKKNEIEILKNEILHYESEINILKEKRKHLSYVLQQKLFNQFQFLNIQGDKKGVVEIFSETTNSIPPSGAGDCAAPKLLQFAFENKLRIIAMAEFWWGQSPRSEIRKHGLFYPACKGKCKPILAFMLDGVAMDENPMIERASQSFEFEIIYEDDSLVVINKPHGLLSVPGTSDLPSVYSIFKEKYSEQYEPLIVHRLDMSTSGLMILAKDKETHKSLQHQFLEKTIKKKYVALLNGIITQEKGTISLPLRPDIDDRPRQMVCKEFGKLAVTQWERVAVTNQITRVHFYPLTGRTHQLRVHAAHIEGLNTSILGDDLYGVQSDRLYLHAETISFFHPKLKKEMMLHSFAPF